MAVTIHGPATYAGIREWEAVGEDGQARLIIRETGKRTARYDVIHRAYDGRTGRWLQTVGLTDQPLREAKQFAREVLGKSDWLERMRQGEVRVTTGRRSEFSDE